MDMRLYHHSQAPHTHTVQTSPGDAPLNPLDTAFPVQNSRVSQVEPEKKKGIFGTAAAQASTSFKRALGKDTDDEAREQSQSLSPQRHDGDEEEIEEDTRPLLHRQRCMDIGYKKVVYGCIALCALCIILIIAAIGNSVWYEVTVTLTPLGGGDPEEAMALRYGFLETCNTTLGNTSCAATSFTSVRCNTEDSDARVTASYLLVIVVLLLKLLLVVCLAVSLCARTAYIKFPTLCFGASLAATLSAFISGGLFMGVVQTSFCDHDMCELLSWEWISVSLPKDIRAGSCQYGASLFLVWAVGFFSCMVTATFALYLLLHKKPVPKLLHGLKDHQKSKAGKQTRVKKKKPEKSQTEEKPNEEEEEVQE